ncbi:hypothetical protein [Flavisolibacter ginsenosidimutans]|uniref:Beta-lactamase-inhibitor-like PepSY-like domain-containing protein n=1 Tax=Flavisolibacter ginsenosidimutans TaxID=661481 RepID=A0A5B8UEP5_9BACT|nr:hypothetical protein [Flavisolibacter ginsenosidimutans]QEC54599.1 hypothetical protein FSB75_01355 [Flavisolibacter ginsenosidimutans]
MKKIALVLVVMIAAFYANAKPPVSEKVLKIFSSTFPGVENPRWYEYENYYEAYFDTGDVKCRAKFDTNGKLISTIRYYGEKMVSPYLKAKLAAKFPGKTIFGVTEVNSENELTYNFVLEDSKTWTHVKSDGTGQMEVTEKFKKAEQ